MDYAKAFHLVAEASKKYEVPCILIGGFAINFYKVAHTTLDIDFLITKDDFKKIEKAMREAGYKENFATDVAVRLTNVNEVLDVDFMIVDEATRAKILNEGKKIEVVGEELIVPSVNHLIALKLHAIKTNPKRRLWKDLPDIIELIKMNKVDFKSRDFKELCMRFGNEEIYKNILNFLES